MRTAIFNVPCMQRLLVIGLVLGLQLPANAALFGDLLKTEEKPIVLDEKSDPRQVLVSAAKDKEPALSVRGDKIKRIGVSALQVTFVTDSSLSQTKKRVGLGATGEARANVNYKLEAPAPSVY